VEMRKGTNPWQKEGKRVGKGKRVEKKRRLKRGKEMKMKVEMVGPKRRKRKKKRKMKRKVWMKMERVWVLKKFWRKVFVVFQEIEGSELPLLSCFVLKLFGCSDGCQWRNKIAKRLSMGVAVSFVLAKRLGKRVKRRIDGSAIASNVVVPNQQKKNKKEKILLSN